MRRKSRSLGHAFSEEVIKITKGRNTKFAKDDDGKWKDSLIPNFDLSFKQNFIRGPWRTTVLIAFTLVVFFILFLRLFHLQIIEGKSSRDVADGNRIQIKIIHAPRGVIYDRNGKILSANSAAFRLYEPDIKKTRLITREEALEMDVKNDPRAQNLEVDNVRTYPKGEGFAHVIGYVGEISPEDLQKPQFKNYKLGDRIGQTGIEAQYESFLKGIDGGEVIEVDSKGRKVRTLRRNAPIPGQSIYLTIDADLQEKLNQLIKDTLAKTGRCCAAAIASDPTSGQILALTSFPSFNPNLFTNSLDEEEISSIFRRTDSPILNRAIAGTYPPGSTFKIITSLGVLASDKITPETIFEDTGVIYLGTFRFSNWYFNQYGRVEGPVNLVKAIQRSNDTYFYQASRIIGNDSIASWAKKLHLGNKLNIDIPGEVDGLIPDDSWKFKNFGEHWYPGDTLHMAIGQGFVLTTPLQILGITSFIAADGQLFKPQLVSKITNENRITRDFKKQVLVSNITAKDKVKIIAEGLKKVPQTGGTAWPFFTFPIPTAGKTGTAEYGDPKGATHAWYTSFAPAEDPKIAMTILIEGGGEGSSVSAPIAKEVYRWYFSPDKSKLIQDVYIPATESGRTLGE